MSPARARLEALSHDLKAFEDQIRDDMKEIRSSLRRIKWALRVAGVLGIAVVVLLVATIVRPLSRQLKQIAGKIDQLENQEVVAALSDVARLRAAIQAETQRIESDTHANISETLDRSHQLSAEIQADLAKLSPNGDAFPEVYKAAKELAAAVDRAGEKLGPAGEFPAVRQKAAALDSRLDAAMAAVDGPEARGRRREFPAVYDKASSLQAKIATAQQRVTGAAPGQPEPPFPDIHASAALVDSRLAAAFRKITGADRGRPEPDFPDLYRQTVSTQKRLKKAQPPPAQAPPGK
ncbi:MAG TPA: hypothetical protein VMT17_02785 [Anaeromyxobacteraceae bacterium]|nr:hypothetical protein [Anaeromyxobacteraceae bacterium]